MSNKKFYFPLITLFFFTQIIIAQIHVDNNGSVGIGTSTPGPLHQLKITSDGTNDSNDKNQYLKVLYTGPTSIYNMTGIYSKVVTSCSTGFAGKFFGGRVGIDSRAEEIGGTFKYGLQGRAYYGGTRNTGVFGIGSGLTTTSSSKNYGVMAYGVGKGDENYGIYAKAIDGTINYAGWFEGDVVITGSYPNPSDEKLKEDLIDFDNALSKIKKINPKKYKYKQNLKVKLSDGVHYGFTAQDIEKVYPELVKEVRHTILFDPDLDENQTVNGKEEKISFKTVNYMEVIPILVQGMQEQQEIIENQKATIENLQNNQVEILIRIENLEKKK